MIFVSFPCLISQVVCSIAEVSWAADVNADVSLSLPANTLHCFTFYTHINTVGQRAWRDPGPLREGLHWASWVISIMIGTCCRLGGEAAGSHQQSDTDRFNRDVPSSTREIQVESPESVWSRVLCPYQCVRLVSISIQCCTIWKYQGQVFAVPARKPL